MSRGFNGYLFKPLNKEALPEPAVLMRIVKYVLSVTPLKSAFGKKGTFLRWKLR